MKFNNYLLCANLVSPLSHILKGPLLFYPQEWVLVDEWTQSPAVVTTYLYTAR